MLWTKVLKDKGKRGEKKEMVLSKKYDFFDDNDKDDFNDFPDTKKETDNDDDDDDDDKSSDSKQILLRPAPDGENVTKITPTNKEYKEPKLETAEKIEKKTKSDGKNLLDVLFNKLVKHLRKK